tara:strand:+ start:20 stop:499 length:480 start_codon:yes stop_codon:yes gene_type:complete
MATMSVQMKDDFSLDELDIELEDKLQGFLEKFSDEIGLLKDSFYVKEESGDFPGIFIFDSLTDEFYSTDDTDDMSLSVFKLLGRLSEKNGDRTPGFSLGQEGFSLEFYKELKEICGNNDIGIECTVSGGGDGYYDTKYELESDGWVVYADFYEENDEDW